MSAQPGLPNEAKVGKPQTEKAPENTVFFVPDIPYDQRVIKGYLRKKYGNSIPNEMVVSQVNMQAMQFLHNLQFVVCVRRAPEGETLGADTEYVYDERGKRIEREFPPEKFHYQVVESPVIKMADHVRTTKATLFTPTESNLNGLINALCEHAWPHRITPQNKPDFMLRFVVGV